MEPRKSPLAENKPAGGPGISVHKNRARVPRQGAVGDCTLVCKRYPLPSGSTARSLKPNQFGPRDQPAWTQTAIRLTVKTGKWIHWTSAPPPTPRCFTCCGNDIELNGSRQIWLWRARRMGGAGAVADGREWRRGFLRDFRSAAVAGGGDIWTARKGLGSRDHPDPVQARLYQANRPRNGAATASTAWIMNHEGVIGCRTPHPPRGGRARSAQDIKNLFAGASISLPHSTPTFSPTLSPPPFPSPPHLLPIYPINLDLNPFSPFVLFAATWKSCARRMGRGGLVGRWGKG